MTNEKRIYVLYHANCFDGTGARFAAWKKFGERATYLPVNYHQPFPESVVLDKNSEVYILDFSYGKEILDDVYGKVGLLKVLDHHKTAQAALEGLPYAEFDMERSGAVMAWQYFHPDDTVPRLLRHVQDGDLWKFKMMETERVRAALPLLRSDMYEWDMLCDDSLNAVWSDFVSKGKAIVDLNEIKVESILKTVRVLPYKGYKAGVYNTTVLTSEAGNAACKSLDLGIDFSMSFFIGKDGGVGWSLRSLADFDVSVLAKQMGGGGHAQAAGFHTDIQFLQDLYAGKL